MAFNENQPRDSRGRWKKGAGDSSEWLEEHAAEVTVGLVIGAAILTGYGSTVAKGVAPAVANLGDDAAKIVTRAATVRKVGPVDLSPLGKVIPAAKDLKSGTAWQYAKGFLHPGKEEGIVHGGIRQFRVGGEVVTKSGTKTFGAKKPLYFDDIKFEKNKNAQKGGGILGFGALGVSGFAWAMGHKDDNDGWLS